jgi:hypothetical protein
MELEVSEPKGSTFCEKSDINFNNVILFGFFFFLFKILIWVYF